MNEWTGKLSRIDAIRIIERATDKEDPAWLWSVEDWYDEDTDTLPSIYHVMAALDVTESEYREATGAQNLNWPDESDSELTTLRARVQELESKVPKWVSVEDGLPEYWEPCLAFRKGQHKERAYGIFYRIGRTDGAERWSFNGASGLSPRMGVTHWMPLPTPPEDSTAGEPE